MPHPRVVEMRRRLMAIMRLADRAARAGHARRVEKLLDAWERGEITTEQLKEELRELAGSKKVGGRCP